MSNNYKDKLHEVNLKIDETTAIIKKDIELTLERGEKIESLEEKSKDLDEMSTKFLTKSRDLKYAECIKQSKVTAAITGIVGIILFIIIYPLSRK